MEQQTEFFGRVLIKWITEWFSFSSFHFCNKLYSQKKKKMFYLKAKLRSMHWIVISCSFRLKWTSLIYIAYNIQKVKVTLHVAKYSVEYSEFVLCIYPIKVHTAVSSEQTTHTHTHTHGAVGSHFCCSARAAWGFGSLLKGLTSVVVLKDEETPPNATFGVTSPTL